MAIDADEDVDKLTMAFRRGLELVKAARTAEALVDAEDVPAASVSFIARGRGRGGPRFNQQRGSGQYPRRRHGPPGPDNTCSSCGSPSHFERECPRKRKPTGRVNAVSKDGDDDEEPEIEFVNAILTVGDTSHHAPTFQLELGGVVLSAVPDVGASACCLSASRYQPKMGEIRPTKLRLAGASSESLTVVGALQARFQLAGRPYSWPVVVVEGLTHQMLLGNDFMKANAVDVLNSQSRLSTPHGFVPLEYRGGQGVGAVLEDAASRLGVELPANMSAQQRARVVRPSER